MSFPLQADSVVEAKLDELLTTVGEAFGGDALTWHGPIQFGVDSVVRRVIEERRQRADGDKLVVLLTTAGGIVEVVQRAVDVVRHHYQTVDFVVPDYAYSAGTVMVMSGDTIYMDYASRLGPIDPQIQQGDRLVPALGYVEQYNALIKKSQKTQLTDAEISVLISSFNQAELYQFEQARELSVSLLKDWLVQYKFKGWTRTETRGMPVTLRMKRQRAAAIARLLSNTGRWHSHDTGISAKVLREELKLQIDDLDGDSSKKEAVANYHGLLEDYMMRRRHFGVIHMVDRYAPYDYH